MLSSEFQQFFQMGGYALYVWLAYGMAMLVLILNLLFPVLKHDKLIKDIARKLVDRQNL